MTDALRPTCPAAGVLDGPPVGGPSVLCGVMTRERELMATGAGRESKAGPLVTSAHDPHSVENFCCGPSLPQVGEDGTLKGYTRCPVWQAAKLAEEERRHRVFDPPVRPATEGADDVMVVEPQMVDDHEMKAFLGDG